MQWLACWAHNPKILRFGTGLRYVLCSLRSGRHVLVLVLLLLVLWGCVYVGCVGLFVLLACVFVVFVGCACWFCVLVGFVVLCVCWVCGFLWVVCLWVATVKDKIILIVFALE